MKYARIWSTRLATCGVYGFTCAPRLLMNVCDVREIIVVATAIPMLPPIFRIRLNRLVALPISSLRIASMVIVVSGTNSIAMNSPWKNCGKNRSQ